VLFRKTRPWVLRVGWSDKFQFFESSHQVGNGWVCFFHIAGSEKSKSETRGKIGIDQKSETRVLNRKINFGRPGIESTGAEVKEDGDCKKYEGQESTREQKAETQEFVRILRLVASRVRNRCWTECSRLRKTGLP